MNGFDFTKLCEFLDASTQRSIPDVKKAFENMFKYLRNNNSELLYPVIRILCIKLDRRRSPFGLGNDKIARIIIDTIGIDKKSEQASKLLKFKQEPIEFSDLVKQAITDRLDNPDSHISIPDIHGYLDQIAISELEKKKDVFLDLLLKLSPTEMFWFIRIILKDLRIRINGETILKLFASEASELWATHTDLEYVVNVGLVGKAKVKTIEVGKSFKPMLSKRATTLADPFKSAKELYVEEKIDGERILLHKANDQYKFFTKNYQDETPRYGNIQEGPLTPKIHSQIHSNTVILDGEMMAYKNGRPLPFGALRKLFGHINEFTNQFSEEDIKGAQMKYMVFDIVLIGDRDLTTTALSTRKKLLDKIVTENDFINVVPFQICSSEKDLGDLLNKQLSNKREGIVCKVPNSQYICGGRGLEWFKVKSSTLGAMDGEFDVVVVGAYYGRGTRSGQLVTFLGSILHNKNQIDMVFTSLCKISGMKKEEYEFIQGVFEEHGQPYCEQEWLNHSNKNKPDHILNPNECCVIAEIKGHEFIKDSGNDYGFDYTIRFPQFMKFRHDKTLEDSETEQNLLNYILENPMITKSIDSISVQISAAQNRPSDEKRNNRKRRRIEIVDVSKKSKLEARLNILNGYSFIGDEENCNLAQELGGQIGPQGNDIMIAKDFKKYPNALSPKCLEIWNQAEKLILSPKQIESETSFDLGSRLKLRCGIHLFEKLSEKDFESISVRDVSEEMVNKIENLF
eukprot:NODE_105_length_19280_cov_0.929461.p2 type:complete len:740 gc:universal NODE_105_length_19280_cov_0.929461:12843-15062(+)